MTKKKTKPRLNADRKKRVRRMLRKKPVEGEVLDVYLCNECGNISAHQYIPYGIGRGLTFNPCMCQAVGGSNWYHRSARRVGRRMSRRVYLNRCLNKKSD